MAKSTVEQIRQRFDNDVERFSNLETGQAATIDSPLCLELIAAAAKAGNPDATALLDIGCGAGNYTVRLLRELPGLSCTLLDLSRPMLDRASQRVLAAGAKSVEAVQNDIRDADWPAGSFDLVLAAAVLHHLRTPAEWQAVFAKLLKVLRPGGSLFVFDMIEQRHAGAHKIMARRYADYLVGLKNETYRDQVLSYIEQEDTPAGLMEQFNWLQQAGFIDIDVLHKNGPFAAFCARKPVE